MRFLFYCFISFFSLSVFALQHGVGAHPGDFNGSPEEYVSLLKKYHFTSFRTDYPWAHVERVAGKFTPIDTNNKTDEIIRISKQQGIDPLLILDYGNPIYDIKKPKGASQIELFGKYVSWVVNHFKGQVRYYEIWNEWSMPQPHAISRSYNSAVDYVNLVKYSSEIIRKIDPKAIIIGGSFNPTSPDDRAWGGYIVKLGLLNYLDGLSIHPYLYRGRKTINSSFVDYSNILSTYYYLSKLSKKKVDLYITEIGVPDAGISSFNQSEIESYYVSYMNLVGELPFVKGIWWYDFIDDGTDKKNDEHHFGVLNRDLSEKPLARKIRMLN